MTTNVDPAVLRLASGGFLSVTMRSARLYLFTSIDGRTFVPTPNAAIEPEQLSPGATGLFDPTLVQLPNGRIFMYATAASDPATRKQALDLGASDFLQKPIEPNELIPRVRNAIVIKKHYDMASSEAVRLEQQENA